MYAIIKSGGKQYRVQEGDEIFIEKLEAEAGEVIRFTEVLAVGEGEAIRFGDPFIEGAVVSGEVQKQGKAKKIVVFKYKAKKGYRRKAGHRQPYTRVKISGLAI